VSSARLLAVAFAAASLTTLGVVVATRAAPASAASGGLPQHVYAPYFETWTRDGITSTAQRSGARYFTLACLQTPRPGSCDLAWNGDQPVSRGRYLSDIAALRALGGDVIPSFGGYTADHGGTELADSCPDVDRIAAAYEAVVTTYAVTRLDLDIESASLADPAGVDRRNKALKHLEDWAVATKRTVQVQYTLPTGPRGLAGDGLAVLRNAVANGTRVDVVNVMAFDYFDGTRDMGTAAVSAAQHLYTQLAGLYPGRAPARLWAMVGVTVLPGSDGPKTEVTTLADAGKVRDFAGTNGFGTLSIWAIQRDNGFAYTHLLTRFSV
jgi:hypothetical protein